MNLYWLNTSDLMVALDEKSWMSDSNFMAILKKKLYSKLYKKNNNPKQTVENAGISFQDQLKLDSDFFFF